MIINDLSVTQQSSLRKLFSSFLIAMSAIAFLFSGVSCSGVGNGNSTGDAGDNGEVVIGLTDAEGDFVTYAVDVTSLTLTKKNGAVVNTMPLSATVDFAQYTEMTEFITAATVPSGIYTKATLTLDYSNADIWVEDANGNAVQITDIQDEQGNAITELDLNVELENANSLLIAPGIPAHLTLDFDLQASNKVNGTTLIVEPFLLADVNPERPKIHRIRGPLKDVDLADSSYHVYIHPFRHHMNDNRHFGTLKVITEDTTVYEINGESYTGSEGLTALDSMPALTATVALGDLKFNPPRFEAHEVYAGSSVPGGTQDVVKGNVIARDGDTLTVKGATLIRSGGSVVFNDEVTVTVDINTRVTRQLSDQAYDKDDISVGQRVTIFGTLTSEIAGQLELDARDGHVRMHLTTLRGTVVSEDVTGSEVIADLQAIDRRRVAIFDFRGTGIDEFNDADQGNYEVSTDTIDISNLDPDDPVKVRGFVRPFGQAPADFDALTIIELQDVPAIMTVVWTPNGGASAFSMLSPESITLSLINAHHFHHVSRNGVITDLTILSASPVVKPEAGDNGLYTIKQPGAGIQVHTSFADFVSDLEDRINSGSLVKSLWAAGGDFDDATATLTARFVTVRLRQAE